MRYSNFNGKDDDDDDDNDDERTHGVDAFFEDIDETQKQMMVAEARLGQLDWEQNILEKAIKMSEKSFGWRLCSSSKKFLKVKDLYQSLRAMMIDSLGENNADF